MWVWNYFSRSWESYSIKQKQLEILLWEIYKKYYRWEVIYETWYIILYSSCNSPFTYWSPTFNFWSWWFGRYCSHLTGLVISRYHHICRKHTHILRIIWNLLNCVGVFHIPELSVAPTRLTANPVCKENSFIQSQLEKLTVNF